MHLNTCRQDTHTYKKGKDVCISCITVMKALDVGYARKNCLVLREGFTISLAGLKLKSSVCLWREPKVCGPSTPEIKSFALAYCSGLEAQHGAAQLVWTFDSCVAHHGGSEYPHACSFLS